MYTDFRQLVEATLEKFEGADKLSKAGKFDLDCRYDHGANGIGCAIGCHLSAEKALEIEEYFSNEPIDFVVDTYKYHGIGKAYIAEVFDLDRITLDDLTRLQQAHDDSANANDFRFKLKNYLDTGEWSSDEDYWND